MYQIRILKNWNSERLVPYLPEGESFELSSGIYPLITVDASFPVGQNCWEYLSHENHLCLGGHRGRKKDSLAEADIYVLVVRHIWPLSNILMRFSGGCLFKMPARKSHNDERVTLRRKEWIDSRPSFPDHKSDAAFAAARPNHAGHTLEHTLTSLQTRYDNRESSH